jgi:hypothetical protein
LFHLRLVFSSEIEQVSRLKSSFSSQTLQDSRFKLIFFLTNLASFLRYLFFPQKLSKFPALFGLSSQIEQVPSSVWFFSHKLSKFPALFGFSSQIEQSPAPFLVFSSLVEKVPGPCGLSSLTYSKFPPQTGISLQN